MVMAWWRWAFVTGALFSLTACVASEPETLEFVEEQPVLYGYVDGYGPIEDGAYSLPPIPPQYLQGVNRRALVQYDGDEPVGTIEVDRHAKLLYYVIEGGMAWRYPIAVGRQGKAMTFDTVIRRKAEWPSWTPTANMLRTEPEVYEPFRGGVEGGLTNPLGARALYLYHNGHDTMFRIHGTNDIASIGNSSSAGCIRMFNQDVIHLYDKIELGTKVVLRSYEDSVEIEGEEVANRGGEIPARQVDPALIYGPDEDDADAADTDMALGDEEAPEAAEG